MSRRYTHEKNKKTRTVLHTYIRDPIEKRHVLNSIQELNDNVRTTDCPSRLNCLCSSFLPRYNRDRCRVHMLEIVYAGRFVDSVEYDEKCYWKSAWQRVRGYMYRFIHLSFIVWYRNGDDSIDRRGVDTRKKVRHMILCEHFICFLHRGRKIKLVCYMNLDILSTCLRSVSKFTDYYTEKTKNFFSLREFLSVTFPREQTRIFYTVHIVH